MYSKANPDGYALALFQLSEEENKIRQIHQYALVLSQILEEDKTLINNLVNGDVPNDAKYRYIDKIFNKIKDSKLLATFIKVLVSRNSANLLKRILKIYLKMANQYLNIKYAQIYSTNKIEEKKLQQIKTKLEKKYNCEVKIENFIDKSLISGFKIKIDSDIIEKSIDLDLKKLKIALLKKEF